MHESHQRIALSCVLDDKIETLSLSNSVHCAIHASEYDGDSLDSASSHANLGDNPHTVQPSRPKSAVSYLNITLKERHLPQSLSA